MYRILARWGRTGGHGGNGGQGGVGGDGGSAGISGSAKGGAILSTTPITLNGQRVSASGAAVGFEANVVTVGAFCSGLAAYCEQRTGTGVCHRPGQRTALLHHP